MHIMRPSCTWKGGPQQNFSQARNKIITCANMVCRSAIMITPQTFNMKCTLVSNKIIDQSDVVEAPPVRAVPTTPSFST